jgi:hypothetical protein
MAPIRYVLSLVVLTYVGIATALYTKRAGWTFLG